ncbi:alpha/beta-hydrolase [Bimuria novae-zelandiae CBS 107.79]|uniref:Alpha/beta-hydrolase n=1 Tax=Bimuria novae-zelandiae CBS 107.79 TaxID=1447943 RepID=A0A6A5UTA9_9PLEO|nr:alpha/beta-hydrolase [Bimuria novae-zelandiae CBS 107.79]
MATVIQGCLSHFGHPKLPSCLLTGIACLGTVVFLRSTSNSLSTNVQSPSSFPRDTGPPHLTPQEVSKLPYPPDPLPGRREVGSPLGNTRVYEWGPEDGRKILLIHGISTPSIALAGLAHKLVERGCRVMLFDLFGRGYSSGPSPTTHRHDSALYAAQILICLQSSPTPWTSFTLIGYSLGGALAADFTSHFPLLIENLILIAPGGLIRTAHITWKSRLLYSTSGILPEWLIHRLVAKRLWSGPETARSMEPEPDTGTTTLNVNDAKSTANEPRGARRNSAVYKSSNHLLLPNYANSTASKVVDWQIEHHPGFVPAFISAIRYAPIHGQQPRWKILRENIERGVGSLRKVHLVLGEADPLIIAEELIEDATEVLGKDNVSVKVLHGVGHEIAISSAEDVADVVEEAFSGRD